MICSLRSVAVGVLVVCAAGIWTPPAGAQQEAGAGEAYRETLARAVSTRLARSAILLTRSFPDPAIEEFRLGALALEIAQRLDPGNEELLRFQLEAWRHAQDDANVLRVTREIVRVNPSDTVAQLRLLTEQVRLQQRIEDRVRLYDTLLGPGGESLDVSVRSRLAFDAALAAAGAW